MGLAPFPPVIHHSLDVKVRDLGIKINSGSYAFILPNEAGFVGADNVCVLVAEEPHKKEEIALIIDIGTNGELVLGNKRKLISSSCATGPALEGAQLSCGMRAAPGAIERITIDPETHEVDYKVIGREAWKSFSEPKEMQTKGICRLGHPGRIGRAVQLRGDFQERALRQGAKVQALPHQPGQPAPKRVHHRLGR